MRVPRYSKVQMRLKLNNDPPRMMVYVGNEECEEREREQ